MRGSYRRGDGRISDRGRGLIRTMNLCGLLVSVLLTGCNIFNWTGEEEPSDMERGLELMRQGEYEEAEEQFALLMAEDPLNADVRYHHAKAVLNKAGFSTPDLLMEVSRSESDRETDGLGIPLYQMETGLAQTVYTVNCIIVDDLTPIYAGHTHGTITAADIDMDLAVASLVTAILGLRDTNRDSAITADDLVFDLHYSGSVEGYTLIGLDQFLGGDGTTGQGCPKGASVDPGQINPFIDDVLDLIDTSRYIVASIIQDLTGETNMTAVESFITDIRATIVKYYHDDDVDNDGDALIDEEILNGLDDDNDGLIDEDTDHV